MEDSAHLLQGIRVVEAATVIMVPSAATILSDYGAEVVKVEPPEGDSNRRIHHITGMPESEHEYCYMQLNRNKKGIVLNLKDTEGRAILGKLLERADIFLSNYRPAALKRLNLTYEDLQPLNPRLICAYGTGYGEEGPEKDKPGYDAISFWSRSGIESTVFPVDGWLSHFPPGAGDHASGMGLFGAIMTALYRREHTGKGAKVSTSLMANGTWANACLIQAKFLDANFLEKRPRSNPRNFIGLHYRVAGDDLIKLSIVDLERDWPPFCRAIGLPELIEDPRFRDTPTRTENVARLVPILDEAFAKHDRAYWQARFVEFDIPHSIVSDYETIAEDEQMTANDMFTEYDHPQLGPTRTVNSPFAIQGSEKVKPKVAPELGQYTEEVLAELGYSKDEVGDFLNRGIAIQCQKRG